jgi:hypothetical protein
MQGILAVESRDCPRAIHDEESHKISPRDLFIASHENIFEWNGMFLHAPPPVSRSLWHGG